MTSQLLTFNKDTLEYIPGYAEETVYHLGQKVYSYCQNIDHGGGKSSTPLSSSFLSSFYVLFISSPSYNITLSEQRTQSGFINIDYHVVLLQMLTNDVANTFEWFVYDLDSTLPFPSRAQDYFPRTLPFFWRDVQQPPFNINNDYFPDRHGFRLITLQHYLDYFSSNRSHMLTDGGHFVVAPSLLPCIQRKVACSECDNGFRYATKPDELIEYDLYRHYQTSIAIRQREYTYQHQQRKLNQKWALRQREFDDAQSTTGIAATAPPNPTIPKLSTLNRELKALAHHDIPEVITVPCRCQHSLYVYTDTRTSYFTKMYSLLQLSIYTRAVLQQHYHELGLFIQHNRHVYPYVDFPQNPDIRLTNHASNKLFDEQRYHHSEIPSRARIGVSHAHIDDIFDAVTQEKYGCVLNCHDLILLFRLTPHDTVSLGPLVYLRLALETIDRRKAEVAMLLTDKNEIYLDAASDYSSSRKGSTDAIERLLLPHLPPIPMVDEKGEKLPDHDRDALLEKDIDTSYRHDSMLFQQSHQYQQKSSPIESQADQLLQYYSDSNPQRVKSYHEFSKYQTDAFIRLIQMRETDLFLRLVDNYQKIQVFKQQRLKHKKPWGPRDKIHILRLAIEMECIDLLSKMDVSQKSIHLRQFGLDGINDNHSTQANLGIIGQGGGPSPFYAKNPSHRTRAARFDFLLNRYKESQRRKQLKYSSASSLHHVVSADENDDGQKIIVIDDHDYEYYESHLPLTQPETNPVMMAQETSTDDQATENAMLTKLERNQADLARAFSTFDYHDDEALVAFIDSLHPYQRLVKSMVLHDLIPSEDTSQSNQKGGSRGHLTKAAGRGSFVSPSTAPSLSELSSAGGNTDYSTLARLIPSTQAVLSSMNPTDRHLYERYSYEYPQVQQKAYGPPLPYLRHFQKALDTFGSLRMAQYFHDLERRKREILLFEMSEAVEEYHVRFPSQEIPQVEIDFIKNELIEIIYSSHFDSIVYDNYIFALDPDPATSETNPEDIMDALHSYGQHHELQNHRNSNSSLSLKGELTSQSTGWAGKSSSAKDIALYLSYHDSVVPLDAHPSSLLDNPTSELQKMIHVRLNQSRTKDVEKSLGTRHRGVGDSTSGFDKGDDTRLIQTYLAGYYGFHDPNDDSTPVNSNLKGIEPIAGQCVSPDQANDVSYATEKWIIYDSLVPFYLPFIRNYLEPTFLFSNGGPYTRQVNDFMKCFFTTTQPLYSGTFWDDFRNNVYTDAYGTFYSYYFQQQPIQYQPSHIQPHHILGEITCHLYEAAEVSPSEPIDVYVDRLRYYRQLREECLETITMLESDDNAGLRAIEPCSDAPDVTYTLQSYPHEYLDSHGEARKELVHYYDHLEYIHNETTASDHEDVVEDQTIVNDNSATVLFHYPVDFNDALSTMDDLHDILSQHEVSPESYDDDFVLLTSYQYKSTVEMLMAHDVEQQQQHPAYKHLNPLYKSKVQYPMYSYDDSIRDMNKNYNYQHYNPTSTIKLSYEQPVQIDASQSDAPSVLSIDVDTLPVFTCFDDKHSEDDDADDDDSADSIPPIYLTQFHRTYRYRKPHGHYYQLFEDEYVSSLDGSEHTLNESSTPSNPAQNLVVTVQDAINTIPYAGHHNFSIILLDGSDADIDDNLLEYDPYHLRTAHLRKKSRQQLLQQQGHDRTYRTMGQTDTNISLHNHVDGVADYPETKKTDHFIDLLQINDALLAIQRYADDGTTILPQLLTPYQQIHQPNRIGEMSHNCPPSFYHPTLNAIVRDYLTYEDYLIHFPPEKIMAGAVDSHNRQRSSSNPPPRATDIGISHKSDADDTQIQISLFSEDKLTALPTVHEKPGIRPSKIAQSTTTLSWSSSSSFTSSVRSAALSTSSHDPAVSREHGQPRHGRLSRRRDSSRTSARNKQPVEHEHPIPPGFRPLQYTSLENHPISVDELRYTILFQHDDPHFQSFNDFVKMFYSTVFPDDLLSNQPNSLDDNVHLLSASNETIDSIIDAVEILREDEKHTLTAAPTTSTIPTSSGRASDQSLSSEGTHRSNVEIKLCTGDHSRLLKFQRFLYKQQSLFQKYSENDYVIHPENFYKIVSQQEDFYMLLFRQRQQHELALQYRLWKRQQKDMLEIQLQFDMNRKYNTAHGLLSADQLDKQFLSQQEAMKDLFGRSYYQIDTQQLQGRYRDVIGFASANATDRDIDTKQTSPFDKPDKLWGSPFQPTFGDHQRYAGIPKRSIVTRRGASIGFDLDDGGDDDSDDYYTDSAMANLQRQVRAHRSDLFQQFLTRQTALKNPLYVEKKLDAIHQKLQQPIPTQKAYDSSNSLSIPASPPMAAPIIHAPNDGSVVVSHPRRMSAASRPGSSSSYSSSSSSSAQRPARGLPQRPRSVSSTSHDSPKIRQGRRRSQRRRPSSPLESLDSAVFPNSKRRSRPSKQSRHAIRSPQRHSDDSISHDSEMDEQSDDVFPWMLLPKDQQAILQDLPSRRLDTEFAPYGGDGNARSDTDDESSYGHEFYDPTYHIRYEAFLRLAIGEFRAWKLAQKHTMLQHHQHQNRGPSPAMKAIEPSKNQYGLQSTASQYATYAVMVQDEWENEARRRETICQLRIPFNMQRIALFYRYYAISLHNLTLFAQDHSTPEAIYIPDDSIDLPWKFPPLFTAICRQQGQSNPDTSKTEQELISLSLLILDINDVNYSKYQEYIDHPELLPEHTQLNNDIAEQSDELIPLFNLRDSLQLIDQEESQKLALYLASDANHDLTDDHLYLPPGHEMNESNIPLSVGRPASPQLTLSQSEVLSSPISPLSHHRNMGYDRSIPSGDQLLPSTSADHVIASHPAQDLLQASHHPNYSLGRDTDPDLRFSLQSIQDQQRDSYQGGRMSGGPAQKSRPTQLHHSLSSASQYHRGLSPSSTDVDAAARPSNASTQAGLSHHGSRGGSISASHRPMPIPSQFQSPYNLFIPPPPRSMLYNDNTPYNMYFDHILEQEMIHRQSIPRSNGALQPYQYNFIHFMQNPLCQSLLPDDINSFLRLRGLTLEDATGHNDHYHGLLNLTHSSDDSPLDNRLNIDPRNIMGHPNVTLGLPPTRDDSPVTRSLTDADDFSHLFNPNHIVLDETTSLKHLDLFGLTIQDINHLVDDIEYREQQLHPLTHHIRLFPYFRAHEQVAAIPTMAGAANRGVASRVLSRPFSSYSALATKSDGLSKSPINSSHAQGYPLIEQDLSISPISLAVPQSSSQIHGAILSSSAIGQRGANQLPKIPSLSPPLALGGSLDASLGEANTSQTYPAVVASQNHPYYYRVNRFYKSAVDDDHTFSDESDLDDDDFHQLAHSGTSILHDTDDQKRDAQAKSKQRRQTQSKLAHRVKEFVIPSFSKYPVQQGYPRIPLLRDFYEYSVHYGDIQCELYHMAYPHTHMHQQHRFAADLPPPVRGVHRDSSYELGTMLRQYPSHGLFYRLLFERYEQIYYAYQDPVVSIESDDDIEAVMKRWDEPLFMDRFSREFVSKDGYYSNLDNILFHKDWASHVEEIASHEIDHLQKSHETQTRGIQHLVLKMQDVMRTSLLSMVVGHATDNNEIQHDGDVVEIDAFSLQCNRDSIYDDVIFQATLRHPNTTQADRIPGTYDQALTRLSLTTLLDEYVINDPSIHHIVSEFEQYYGQHDPHNLLDPLKDITIVAQQPQLQPLFTVSQKQQVVSPPVSPTGDHIPLLSIGDHNLPRQLLESSTTLATIGPQRLSEIELDMDLTPQFASHVDLKEDYDSHLLHRQLLSPTALDLAPHEIDIRHLALQKETSYDIRSEFLSNTPSPLVVAPKPPSVLQDDTAMYPLSKLYFKSIPNGDQSVLCFSADIAATFPYSSALGQTSYVSSDTLSGATTASNLSNLPRHEIDVVSNHPGSEHGNDTPTNQYHHHQQPGLHLMSSDDDIDDLDDDDDMFDDDDDMFDAMMRYQTDPEYKKQLEKQQKQFSTAHQKLKAASSDASSFQSSSTQVLDQADMAQFSTNDLLRMISQQFHTIFSNILFHNRPTLGVLRAKDRMYRMFQRLLLQGRDNTQGNHQRWSRFRSSSTSVPPKRDFISTPRSTSYQQPQQQPSVFSLASPTSTTAVPDSTTLQTPFTSTLKHSRLAINPTSVSISTPSPSASTQTGPSTTLSSTLLASPSYSHNPPTTYYEGSVISTMGENSVTKSFLLLYQDEGLAVYYQQQLDYVSSKQLHSHLYILHKNIEDIRIQKEYENVLWEERQKRQAQRQHTREEFLIRCATQLRLEYNWLLQQLTLTNEYAHDLNQKYNDYLLEYQNSFRIAPEADSYEGTTTVIPPSHHISPLIDDERRHMNDNDDDELRDHFPTTPVADPDAPILYIPTDRLQHADERFPTDQQVAITLADIATPHHVTSHQFHQSPSGDFYDCYGNRIDQHGRFYPIYQNNHHDDHLDITRENSPEAHSPISPSNIQYPWRINTQSNEIRYEVVDGTTIYMSAYIDSALTPVHFAFSINERGHLVSQDGQFTLQEDGTILDKQGNSIQTSQDTTQIEEAINSGLQLAELDEDALQSWYSHYCTAGYDEQLQILVSLCDRLAKTSRPLSHITNIDYTNGSGDTPEVQTMDTQASTHDDQLLSYFDITKKIGFLPDQSLDILQLPIQLIQQTQEHIAAERQAIGPTTAATINKAKTGGATILHQDKETGEMLFGNFDALLEGNPEHLFINRKPLSTDTIQRLFHRESMNQAHDTDYPVNLKIEAESFYQHRLKNTVQRRQQQQYKTWLIIKHHERNYQSLCKHYEGDNDKLTNEILRLSEKRMEILQDQEKLTTQQTQLQRIYIDRMHAYKRVFASKKNIKQMNNESEPPEKSRAMSPLHTLFFSTPKHRGGNIGESQPSPSSPLPLHPHLYSDQRSAHHTTTHSSTTEHPSSLSPKPTPRQHQMFHSRMQDDFSLHHQSVLDHQSKIPQNDSVLTDIYTNDPGFEPSEDNGDDDILNLQEEEQITIDRLIANDARLQEYQKKLIQVDSSLTKLSQQQHDLHTFFIFQQQHLYVLLTHLMKVYKQNHLGLYRLYQRYLLFVRYKHFTRQMVRYHSPAFHILQHLPLVKVKGQAALTLVPPSHVSPYHHLTAVDRLIAPSDEYYFYNQTNIMNSVAYHHLYASFMLNSNLFYNFMEFRVDGKLPDFRVPHRNKPRRPKFHHRHPYSSLDQNTQLRVAYDMSRRKRYRYFTLSNPYEPSDIVLFEDRYYLDMGLISPLMYRKYVQQKVGIYAATLEQLQQERDRIDFTMKYQSLINEQSHLRQAFSEKIANLKQYIENIQQQFKVLQRFSRQHQAYQNDNAPRHISSAQYGIEDYPSTPDKDVTTASLRPPSSIDPLTDPNYFTQHLQHSKKRLPQHSSLPGYKSQHPTGEYQQGNITRGVDPQNVPREHAFIAPGIEYLGEIDDIHELSEDETPLQGGQQESKPHTFKAGGHDGTGHHHHHSHSGDGLHPDITDEDSHHASGAYLDAHEGLDKEDYLMDSNDPNLFLYEGNLYYYDVTDGVYYECDLIDASDYSSLFSGIFDVLRHHPDVAHISDNKYSQRLHYLLNAHVLDLSDDPHISTPKKGSSLQNQPRVVPPRRKRSRSTIYPHASDEARAMEFYPDSIDHVLNVDGEDDYHDGLLSFGRNHPDFTSDDHDAADNDDDSDSLHGHAVPLQQQHPPLLDKSPSTKSGGRSDHDSGVLTRIHKPIQRQGTDSKKLRPSIHEQSAERGKLSQHSSAARPPYPSPSPSPHDSHARLSTSASPLRSGTPLQLAKSTSSTPPNPRQPGTPPVSSLSVSSHAAYVVDSLTSDKSPRLPSFHNSILHKPLGYSRWMTPTRNTTSTRPIRSRSVVSNDDAGRSSGRYMIPSYHRKLSPTTMGRNPAAEYLRMRYHLVLASSDDVERLTLYVNDTMQPPILPDTLHPPLSTDYSTLPSYADQQQYDMADQFFQAVDISPSMVNNCHISDCDTSSVCGSVLDCTNQFVANELAELLDATATTTLLNHPSILDFFSQIIQSYPLNVSTIDKIIRISTKSSFQSPAGIKIPSQSQTILVYNSIRYLIQSYPLKAPQKPLYPASVIRSMSDEALKQSLFQSPPTLPLRQQLFDVKPSPTPQAMGEVSFPELEQLRAYEVYQQQARQLKYRRQFYLYRRFMRQQQDERLYYGNEGDSFQQQQITPSPPLAHFSFVYLHDLRHILRLKAHRRTVSHISIHIDPHEF